MNSKNNAFEQELINLLSQRAKLFLETITPAGESQTQKSAPSADTRSADASFEKSRAELDALLHRIVALNEGPLSDRCIRAISRELMSGLLALQKPLRVAYLGPQYSYSHIATMERFGESVELVAVANISAVFEEVDRGQSDFGMVPIENSTDGRIVDTLNMFTRLPIRICGEVQLPIHHNLLSKCSRTEVQEVYSKPQALSQCREWLACHLPAAKTFETSSTTAAAALAADKPATAAIASLQAGVHYELDTLAANIEDNPNNITRFAVIGKVLAERTGNDKTALMFKISHAPGSLADTMAIFKRSNLNLTWIESFPISGTNSQYLFFVELEGHLDDSNVQKALASLKEKSLRLEILGSFAKQEPLP